MLVAGYQSQKIIKLVETVSFFETYKFKTLPTANVDCQDSQWQSKLICNASLWHCMISRMMCHSQLIVTIEKNIAKVNKKRIKYVNNKINKFVKDKRQRQVIF